MPQEQEKISVSLHTNINLNHEFAVTGYNAIYAPNQCY